MSEACTMTVVETAANGINDLPYITNVVFGFSGSTRSTT